MKEENIDAEGWVKQEQSLIWIPEQPGEKLVGEIIGQEEGTYGTQYVVKREDDGEEIRTPSHRALQSRMAKAKVGQLVKIVFKEEMPPSIRGNNPTKIYDVYLKDKE